MMHKMPIDAVQLK